MASQTRECFVGFDLECHFDVFPSGAITTKFSGQLVQGGQTKRCFGYILVKKSTM